LSQVGVKGQETLKDSSILVIGAGGLGSPVLLYLAAAGVGHLGIVDDDVVDESNLQRQILHGVSTVGVSKCQSAISRIRDVNPHVQVRTYETKFTSQTAEEILSQGFRDPNDKDNHASTEKKQRKYDIVIDGSDNFPTKYLINDVCAMYNVPWVYGAILGFEGQVSLFDANVVDYRDLLPTPPPPGEVPSCAEGGVLGVLPGTIGCLQATEAIKYLLGLPTLLGRVLVFDALAMKFTDLRLARSSSPDGPTREPITKLIDYQGFCGGPQATTTTTTTNEILSVIPSFHEIDARECLDKFMSGWTPWVLDVRLPTEHNIVALPFTDRVVPHRQVQAADIPTSGDVLVYCKAGVRGRAACRKLVEVHGIDPQRLYNLKGGIMQWQSEIDPSMPRY
jgi:adenylyltransferase/sulfurtransferase